jgi:hypothetical protein
MICQLLADSSGGEKILIKSDYRTGSIYFGLRLLVTS